MKTVIKLILFSLLILKYSVTLGLSLEDQDAKFREQVVGKEQIAIEQALIQADKGIFILFTPDIGTPLMISAKGEIPTGLIPQQRMKSYEKTVQPRVITTHRMLEHGIKIISIRKNQHRKQANSPNQFVDEKHYQALLKQYPQQLIEKVIDADLFEYSTQQRVPTAFYYYFPKNSHQPQTAAVFGKQINANPGNQLRDPGVYYNRTQDLVAVNALLQRLEFDSVENMI